MRKSVGAMINNHEYPQLCCIERALGGLLVNAPSCLNVYVYVAYSYPWIIRTTASNDMANKAGYAIYI